MDRNNCGFGPVPEEFKNFPRTSPSKLADFLESPYHYYYNNVLKKREQTKAMQDGNLIDMAILEPEKFAQSYVLPPSKAEITKKGYLILDTVAEITAFLLSIGIKGKGKKDELIAIFHAANKDPKVIIWDTFLSEKSSGKELLTPGQSEMVLSAAESVLKHKWLSKAFTGGEFQKYGWVFHRKSGFVITFKPDYFHLELGSTKVPVVIDLKKVRSCNPRMFAADVARSKKYLQAAMYVDAIEAITRKEPLFVWACVEGQGPFIAEAFAADFGLLEAGRTAYEKILLNLKECMEKNQWPTYSGGDVIPVGLPNWEMDFIANYYNDEEC